MDPRLPPPLDELLDAWNAWDVERAVALMHPEVEIRGLRAALENTTYRGPAEARQFFEDVRESWVSAVAEVREVEVFGDRVAASLVLRLRARETRMEFERPVGTLYELDGGLVRRWITYFDAPGAREIAAMAGYPSRP